MYTIQNVRTYKSNFMKRHHYILTIENPCTKEWTSMTGTDCERYCSSCSKAVTDFTHLTDNQILAKIENTNGKICGRLTEKQLQRGIIATEQGVNKSLIPKFFGGLLLFGMVDDVKADDTKAETEIVENLYSDNKEKLNTEQHEKPDKDSLKNIVEGQIIDADTKETLIFANVLIKGSTTETVTDVNGNFRLVIPDSLMSDKIVLTIKYIGYKETEFSIKATDLPLLKKILIIKAEHVLTGEVVIIKKKRWWQF